MDVVTSLSDLTLTLFICSGPVLLGVFRFSMISLLLTKLEMQPLCSLLLLINHSITIQHSLNVALLF